MTDPQILESVYIRMAQNEYVNCAGSKTIETNPYAIKRLKQVIAGGDLLLVDTHDSGVGDLDVETAKDSGKFVIVKVGEQAAVAAASELEHPSPPASETVSNTPAAQMFATQGHIPRQEWI
jgi:hypothetical protein